MKTATTLLFSFLLSVSVFAGGPVPAPKPDVVGTWELRRAEYNGQPWSGLKAIRMLKLVTPEAFCWMRIEPATGRVVSMAWGRWSIEGEVYTEFPLGGVGDDAAMLKGHREDFSIEMDKDGWHHLGTLNDGTLIDELWVPMATEP